MGPEVEIRWEGPVCRIMICRPKALNALNSEVLHKLGDILLSDEVSDWNQCRAIVLEGAGERAFIAGADIAEMQNLSPMEAREFARLGQSITLHLENLPQVTIAKVQGYALGAGCEFAMACDIVIAAKSASFGQPEVNLGLIPGFGGTQRLIKRVGKHVAMDLLLSGRARSLSGTDAYALGLCSRVVDDHKLEEEVQKVLKGILSAGPEAVMDTKRLAREAANMSLEAGLHAEAAVFGGLFDRAETEQGIQAFLEKRNPPWSIP